MEKLTPVSLFRADSRANGSFNSTVVDKSRYSREVTFLLDSEAGSGTGPTMDMKLQHSDDNSTWEDVTDGAFTQVTNSANAFEAKHMPSEGLKRYVRANVVIAGTSPVFVCALSAIFRSKYQS